MSMAVLLRWPRFTGLAIVAVNNLVDTSVHATPCDKPHLCWRATMLSMTSSAETPHNVYCTVAVRLAHRRKAARWATPLRALEAELTQQKNSGANNQ